MNITEIMGTHLHDYCLHKGMMLTTMTFKNRIDSWLLITKVTVAGGVKRVAFTNGRTPGKALLNMEKALMEGKLSFRDDTPYIPPIDDSL